MKMNVCIRYKENTEISLTCLFFLRGGVLRFLACLPSLLLPTFQSLMFVLNWMFRIFSCYWVGGMGTYTSIYATFQEGEVQSFFFFLKKENIDIWNLSMNPPWSHSPLSLVFTFYLSMYFCTCTYTVAIFKLDLLKNISWNLSVNTQSLSSFRLVAAWCLGGGIGNCSMRSWRRHTSELGYECAFFCGQEIALMLMSRQWWEKEQLCQVDLGVRPA